MVFDPTKTDAERKYDDVEEKFPDAWLELFDKYGQTMLKAEPPRGEDAKQKAERIKMFLSEMGLRTELNCLSDDGDLYEVVATAENW